MSAKHDAFFVLFSQMKALFGGDSGGAPARARLVERIVNEMRGAAVEGAAAETELHHHQQQLTGVAMAETELQRAARLARRT